MRHVLRSTVTLAALGAVSVSPALAQTGASSGQDTPRQHQRQGDEKRQGVQPRAQDQRNERETKELEGTVRKVDEESQALRVSNGMLGLGDTTLQVTDQTRIRVEGGTGSLWDLREGTRIRASYEDRQGINVARSIEVRPSERQGTPRVPGTTPSGPAGQTSGSGGKSSGSSPAYGSGQSAGSNRSSGSGG